MLLYTHGGIVLCCPHTKTELEKDLNMPAIHELMEKCHAVGHFCMCGQA